MTLKVPVYMPILQEKTKGPVLVGVNSRVSLPVSGRILDNRSEGMVKAREQPPVLLVVKVSLVLIPLVRVILFG
jgi:hypothetical protein